MDRWLCSAFDPVDNAALTAETAETAEQDRRPAPIPAAIAQREDPMWRFQMPLAGAAPGEKRIDMQRIAMLEEE